MAWDSGASLDAVVADIVITRWAAGKPTFILLVRQHFATLVTLYFSCRTHMRVGIASRNLEHMAAGASGTVFAEVKVTEFSTGVITTLRGDRQLFSAAITKKIT